MPATAYACVRQVAAAMHDWRYSEGMIACVSRPLEADALSLSRHQSLTPPRIRHGLSFACALTHSPLLPASLGFLERDASLLSESGVSASERVSAANNVAPPASRLLLPLLTRRSVTGHACRQAA